MSRHIRKCKWCEYGAFSYKWAEWNCWYDERPLTDKEAKIGCNHFKPNKLCPKSIMIELGFDVNDLKLLL